MNETTTIDVAAPGRKPSHQWAVSFDLGNGRSIAVNANFHVGDTEAEMSQQFDAIMRVLERQRARAEVDILKSELKLRQKRYAQIEIQLAEMKARQGELRTSKAPQARQQLAQVESQIAQHTVNLEAMKLEVAEGEANLAEGDRKAA